MCGIVGVVQYKSEIPRHIRQRALKILFSDTMLRTEVRGEDATGMYQVHTDGDWALAKKGVKVSQWLFLDEKNCGEDPVVYSDFMDSWLEHPYELTALVGHCRKATVGSKGEDNEDNHPFSVQLDERNAILGVHNGTLSNHEIIFKNLPEQLDRQGSVDSESIFHLLFHLSEEGTKPFDGGMLRTLGTRLEGSFACIVVNSRFPNIVATFREGRPLDYIAISPLNVVVLASDKKFIQAAIEKYDFIRQMLDKELPALETWDASILDRDYRIFDATRDFGTGKPNYQTMEQISDKGEMRKHGVSIDSAWKTPTSNTSSDGGYSGTTQGNYSGQRSSQQSQTSSRTTGAQGPESEESRVGCRGIVEAQTSKPRTALPAQASSSSDDDDDTRVVEVEVGSEEDTARGLEKARGLGLCPVYVDLGAVGAAIGMSAKEVCAEKRTLFLANRIAQAHFNIGYAVARTESQAEVKKWREGVKKISRKLEVAEKKKNLAQQRVWAITHLLMVAAALSRCGYHATLSNMLTGVGHLPDDKVDEGGIQQLEEATKELLESPSFEKVVEELMESLLEAKARAEKAAGKTGKTQRAG